MQPERPPELSAPGSRPTPSLRRSSAPYLAGFQYRNILIDWYSIFIVLWLLKTNFPARLLVPGRILATGRFFPTPARLPVSSRMVPPELTRPSGAGEKIKNSILLIYNDLCFSFFPFFKVIGVMINIIPYWWNNYRKIPFFWVENHLLIIWYICKVFSTYRNSLYFKPPIIVKIRWKLGFGNSSARFL